MAAPEGAAIAINVLNKVIRYAVGLGLGASALQTSLYNGVLIESSSGVLRASAHVLMVSLQRECAVTTQLMAASARSYLIASGECYQSPSARARTSAFPGFSSRTSWTSAPAHAASARSQEPRVS